MTDRLNPRGEERIAGPFELFHGSFILEFLKPDASRDASVLMRVTYKHGHPLCKKGKQHPQRPPYHIHFDQIESFQVLRGSIGTTAGYNLIDTIHTPDKITHNIPAYLPHTFWPDPNATEDSTLLLWAHPSAVEGALDGMFFKMLLTYVSDASEGKARLDPLQVMATHHGSGSALVMFPTAWWLGSLRWRIPWHFQVALAGLARLLGYEGLPERYITAADRRIFEKLGHSE